MCQSNTDRNQTPAQVVEYCLKNEIVVTGANSIKGVGIFLIPDPEAGILEYRKVFVDQLGYDECRKRGANCVAFQWFPYGFKLKLGKKNVTLKSSKDFPDDPIFCNDTCRGGCPLNGCFCYPDDVFCH